jgi:hypothetical protein
VAVAFSNDDTAASSRASSSFRPRFSNAGAAGLRWRWIAEGRKERAYTLDPEVVAILRCAFQAVFAEPDLSDTDKVFFAFWVARRIIDLSSRGERDPDGFKASIRAWATK